MTGYILFWYLLGLKLTWGHAHKTRSWYLLGVTFRKSDEHPRHFWMGVPPGLLPLLCYPPLSLSLPNDSRCPDSVFKRCMLCTFLTETIFLPEASWKDDLNTLERFFEIKVRMLHN